MGALVTAASWKTNVFVVWAWTNGPNSLQRRQEALAASPPLAALPDPCRWCQVEGERPTWRQRSHLHELRAELLRGPKVSTATKPEKSAVIQPLKDCQCSRTTAFDSTFGPLTTCKKCAFTARWEEEPGSLSQAFNMAFSLLFALMV